MSKKKKKIGGNVIKYLKISYKIHWYLFTNLMMFLFEIFKFGMTIITQS